MKLLLPLIGLGLFGTAQAEPFKLILQSSEQKIQKGELSTHSFQKSWGLPKDGIERSREYGKVSTWLTPTLDRIEAEVNARQPRPAVFRNVEGQWIATDQNGWIFDRDGTKANILGAIEAGKDAAPVAYTKVEPERSVKLLAERGVFWHVSTGKSSFAGSPDFRVKNILVGASKLDNFFIAPGHVFDFNEEIGQIDASTGFVKGFIIAGGTLEKEDGGGICQISTTIFRALYEAGLPIVERHDHSHRVKYYDPVGFEATVYAPAKNLRMENDTGKYLFVQAGWNTAEQTLRFDVFGANTGREVSISDPIITDFKAPADPSYTPDSRVRLGQRRLLEQPMQGMKSVITRTIKVNGNVINQDDLVSNYSPWGTVYGVHPSDKRLK